MRRRSSLTLRSADEKVERMVNIWNQYQGMVTFNMSRSASYYESGMGYGKGLHAPGKQLPQEQLFTCRKTPMCGASSTGR